MRRMTRRSPKPGGKDRVPPADGECDPKPPGLEAVASSLHQRAPTAHEAFERYVVPELDVLLRVAMSLTRNSADAEDLVQDTLLRAYGAIERFDGRYPRAWLLTIMRNAQVNRVRRRRPELIRDPDAGDRILESQTPHDSAENDALRGAFDAAVEDALDALPDTFNQVVRLVDLDGLSYQEAADVMGVPIGTVMSRLHRARQRIRGRLRDTGLVTKSPMLRDGARGLLSCRQVGKILQSFLDAELDDAATDRVAEHLEDCRRCGMAADLYLEIKASLGRDAPGVPEESLTRLEEFAQRLALGERGDPPTSA